ncbi:MAG: thioredoxin [Christensenellaceae bacterium]|nr:thioredoxin [Christensenellaceae bacterium]
MNEIRITSENFEKEVLQSDIPIMLDFWAEWCGPCRMIAPILSEIAEEWAGKVKIGKINVDEQPLLAAKFNVMSIPTVILFKNGEPVNGFVGYRPKEAIEEMLK